LDYRGWLPVVAPVALVLVAWVDDVAAAAPEWRATAGRRNPPAARRPVGRPAGFRV